MSYYASSNPAKLMPSSEIEAKYYLRIVTEDKKGVLAEITNQLASSEISIESVVQKPSEEGKDATIIVVTHMSKEENLSNAVKAIDGLASVKSDTQFIRFI